MKFFTLALIALFIGVAAAAPSKDTKKLPSELGKNDEETNDNDWRWHKSKIVVFYV